MDISNYLDIVVRTACVYLFLVFAIRLFGKREISQLSTTDLAFIVLISNSVQNAMVGADSSLTGGLVAATILFAMSYLLKLAMYRSPAVKEAIEGKPVILIYGGKIDIAHMHQERITMDELEETIREHGVDSYKDVQLAVLEVDGNISVISSGSHGLRQTNHKIKKARRALNQIS